MLSRNHESLGHIFTWANCSCKIWSQQWSWAQNNPYFWASKLDSWFLIYWSCPWKHKLSMNAGRFHCIVATSIPSGKANSIRTGTMWPDLGYKTKLLNSDCLWQLFLAHANPYLFPSFAWRKIGGPGQKDTEAHPTTRQCRELAPVFVSVLCCHLMKFYRRVSWASAGLLHLVRAGIWNTVLPLKYMDSF